MDTQEYGLMAAAEEQQKNRQDRTGWCGARAQGSCGSHRRFKRRYASAGLEDAASAVGVEPWLVALSANEIN